MHAWLLAAGPTASSPLAPVQRPDAADDVGLGQLGADGQDQVGRFGAAAVENNLPLVGGGIAGLARLVTVDQHLGTDLPGEGVGAGRAKLAAPNEPRRR